MEFSITRFSIRSLMPPAALNAFTASSVDRESGIPYDSSTPVSESRALVPNGSFDA